MTTTTTTSTFKGLPVIPPNDPSLSKPLHLATARKIAKSFPALEQAEGIGARVRRSIGSPRQRNLSPFLLLDHFTVAQGAGFGDHFHRGMETITYLLSGGVAHEDFSGASGELGPGDLQFMTAGKGIMHAEMPRVSADGAPSVGMQLWVDLPAELKMCEPRYRDLRAAEVPLDSDADAGVDDGSDAAAQSGGVSIKVISGRSSLHGVESAHELSYTPVWLLDVTLQPGARLEQALPHGWNAFAYVIDGSVVFGEGSARVVAEQYSNTVFERAGDKVVASVDAGAAQPARFVLAAGMPLDQPVVQYGPFVVTSREAVMEALADVRGFKNGFERGRGWQSEIAKSLA